MSSHLLCTDYNNPFKDNRAIFKIPSKSKSIKSYENLQKCACARLDVYSVEMELVTVSVKKCDIFKVVYFLGMSLMSLVDHVIKSTVVTGLLS